MVAAMSPNLPEREVSSAEMRAPWPEMPFGADDGSRPRAGGEVPSPGQAHVVAAGGPVERFGHRCAPVDDDRVLLVVAHRDPADVVRRRIVDRVDAPEAQGRISEVQLGQPVQHRVPDDVAFEASLLGAAPADLHHGAQPGGRLPGVLEELIGPVDVGLFRLEIGVCHGLLCWVDRPRPTEPVRSGDG
jgi:hypothetical protein